MPAASGKRGRSAITGKFVKQSTVKRTPKTTVNESLKKAPKKRTKCGQRQSVDTECVDRLPRYTAP